VRYILPCSFYRSSRPRFLLGCATTTMGTSIGFSREKCTCFCVFDSSIGCIDAMRDRKDAVWSLICCSTERCIVVFWFSCPLVLYGIEGYPYNQLIRPINFFSQHLLQKKKVGFPLFSFVLVTTYTFSLVLIFLIHTYTYTIQLTFCLVL